MLHDRRDGEKDPRCKLKKGEALASQFRPRVRGIEDPKVGQTKMKTVEGSVVLLRQFTPLWAFKKSFCDTISKAFTCRRRKQPCV
jgi:hypothetical protein